MRAIIFCLISLNIFEFGFGSQRDQAKQKASTIPQKACRVHGDCPSKVCNHYKKNMGNCAPLDCQAGEVTDNGKFYCSLIKKWQATKGEGANCEKSYECRSPSCFMNPLCDSKLLATAKCQDNKCILTKPIDSCTGRGMVRVLAKEEWIITADGRCMQGFAQRALRKVCVPCGNGVCDPLESKCNCPKDCKK